jgi:protein-disulfide isomerase
MTLKTGLATALVAAAVAAVVSAGTVASLWFYLTKNPEILAEMRAELNRHQQEEQAAQRQKAMSDNADALYRSDKAHFVGNPKGDVTVVEFFDYNCAFCRRAMPDVVKLLENDDRVKVVLKELPIFGDDSEDAAKGALAAAKQGKYFYVHQKLLSDPGRANKDKVLGIAKEIGLDLSRLEEDMEGKDVQAALDEVRELAQKVGIGGTPIYLIGDRIVGGAPEDLYDQLVAKVAEVREQGCKSPC